MEHVRGHCMTLYHAAGTCRMGSDTAAVVDAPALKLDDIENPYVDDASVIPRMISGNIRAAVIAIVERAARSIRNNGRGFREGRRGFAYPAVDRVGSITEPDQPLQIRTGRVCVLEHQVDVDKSP